MILARSRSLACVDDIGRACALAAHAHVERAIEAEREAAPGRVELHRRNAEIEHDAVDRLEAGIARNRVEIGEAIFDQRQAAFAPATRSAPSAMAVWSRSMPITLQSAAARIARV